MFHFWLSLILFCVVISTVIVWPIARYRSLAFFQKCFIVLMSALLVMMMIVLLYRQYGNWPQIVMYQHDKQTKAAATQMLQTLKTPDAVIAKLKASIAHHPDKGQGYLLLGRLYWAKGDSQRAKQAYLTAGRYKPDDVHHQVSVLQALYTLQDHHFTPAQHKRVQALAVQMDADPAIRWLLAQLAYDEGRYLQAEQLWGELLAQAEPESEIYDVIAKLVAKAKLHQSRANSAL